MGPKAFPSIIGVLPGLGPSNGVAILIPLAFSLGLPATRALILLTSIYYGAMYGGRISSILLNIPGDEPALMTTLDGYPMAQQGRAGEALALPGVAPFVGAFFATATGRHSSPRRSRSPSGRSRSSASCCRSSSARRSTDANGKGRAGGNGGLERDPGRPLAASGLGRRRPTQREQPGRPEAARGRRLPDAGYDPA